MNLIHDLSDNTQIYTNNEIGHNSISFRLVKENEIDIIISFGFIFDYFDYFLFQFWSKKLKSILVDIGVCTIKVLGIFGIKI